MRGKPDIAISDAEWHIVRDILNKHISGYPVWAFGSRVRRTHKPFSDLDIVVGGDHPLTISTLAALNEAFTESDLPWKVDIVDAATISDAFLSHIETHKVALQ